MIDGTKAVNITGTLPEGHKCRSKAERAIGELN
jgi:hypothetical protein